MHAGLYSPSLTARLAHLCDTVIGLEAVRDDSDIVRLIPEPARYWLLVIHQHCQTALLQLQACQALMLKRCLLKIALACVVSGCVDVYLLV